MAVIMYLLLGVKTRSNHSTYFSIKLLHNLYNFSSTIFTFIISVSEGTNFLANGKIFLKEFLVLAKNLTFLYENKACNVDFSSFTSLVHFLIILIVQPLFLLSSIILLHSVNDNFWNIQPDLSPIE